VILLNGTVQKELLVLAKVVVDWFALKVQVPWIDGKAG
jgi:hypothetical protein